MSGVRSHLTPLFAVCSTANYTDNAYQQMMDFDNEYDEAMGGLKEQYDDGLYEDYDDVEYEASESDRLYEEEYAEHNDYDNYEYGEETDGLYSNLYADDTSDEETEDNEFGDDYLEELLEDDDYRMDDYNDEFGWQQYSDLYDAIDSLRDGGLNEEEASYLDDFYQDLITMDDIDEEDELNRWSDYYHGLDDLEEMDDFDALYEQELKGIAGYLEELQEDEDDVNVDSLEGDYEDYRGYQDYSDLYEFEKYAHDYYHDDALYDGKGDSEDNEWSNANAVLGEYYEYANAKQDEGEWNQLEAAYSDMYGDDDGHFHGEDHKEDGGYYSQKDAYYSESIESQDDGLDAEERWNEIRYPTDLQDNAWVWKLLILSFALGVCSCLCYYATKVKPAAGKRYDFGHGRHGKYSQVGLDSAYDHDDIIDQRSVIEQTD